MPALQNEFSKILQYYINIWMQGKHFSLETTYVYETLGYDKPKSKIVFLFLCLLPKNTCDRYWHNNLKASNYVVFIIKILNKNSTIF